MNRSFFERDTVEVAKDLLGWHLISSIGGDKVVVAITETEAYKGDEDPASHAFGRVTPRNEIMFGKPGMLYVYLSYGMHDCMNIVTEKEGTPGAVLLRSAVVIEGLETVRRRRPTTVPDKHLMDGPGKLTKALGITREYNGYDLFTGRKDMMLVPNEVSDKSRIIATPRIGISKAKDYPWRFVLSNHGFGVRD